MLLRTIAIAVISLLAWVLTMRYNLHMLQLNGYKLMEHLHWLRKNAGRQRVLIPGMLLGVARLFFKGLPWDIVLFVYLAFVALIYNLLRVSKAKKKLVYTARVKRMLVMHVLLSAAVPALVWLARGSNFVSGGLMLMVSLQWILIVLPGFVMKPAEKLVGRYYINDAKKKLRAVPNLQIVGVTGSYGKTSVKFYLKSLLSARYDVLVTPESFNTPMGVVRTIREGLKSSHEVFVCEMGARHVGDIKEICDIVHPAHGIITSIGPQHLETFFNMENIENTKFELADALPEGGMLFLNGDLHGVQNGDAVTGQNGDLAVFHVADLAGVLDEGSHVGGDIAAAVAVAEQKRRVLARCDDAVGAIRTEHPKRIRALDAAQHPAHRLKKVVTFVVVELQKLRDDLCVRFRLEVYALIDEKFLDLHIVLDDAVVDDGEFPARADVRVGVDLARCAVCRPAGMSHADAALEIRAAVNGVAEHLKPPLRLAHLQFMLRRDDRNAGRVIPAVFKSCKPVKQDGSRLFAAHKSNNSTHTCVLLFALFVK